MHPTSYKALVLCVVVFFVAILSWLAWGLHTPSKSDVGKPDPVQTRGHEIDDFLKGPWDCDDEDPSVHPGATEIVDGKDNDCDGETDEVPCVEDADCVSPKGIAPLLTETFWSDGAYLFGCMPPVKSEIGWSCRKCEDPDRDGYCESTESRCDDDIDGDLDGLTDHGDRDCANPPP